jgi:hypothetical protein
MVVGSTVQMAGVHSMLEVTVKEEPREQTLTANERCDSCGSQAYVHIFGVSGELMFCAHHYTKIENNIESKTAMNKFAYKIVDERNFL